MVNIYTDTQTVRQIHTHPHTHTDSMRPVYVNSSASYAKTEYLKANPT